MGKKPALYADAAGLASLSRPILEVLSPAIAANSAHYVHTRREIVNAIPKCLSLAVAIPRISS